MSGAVEQPFSFRDYGRLLRTNAEYRKLWLAQVVSEIGDWLYTVCVYALLLELTGRAESVGLAVVLQLLPQVFIAPTAGVINDRLSRRTVMIFADVARIFIILSMLFVRDASMVWLIYVVLVAETFMWALFEPGRSAIIPSLCPEPKQMVTANALSSITWSINLMLGAGLGGFIAYHFGRDTVFVIDAFTFVLSAALLLSMRVRETHTESHPPFRAKDLVDFKPVWEGVRYVRRDPRLVATMLVKAGMGLLGAHWVILPIYADRVFPIGGSNSLSMSILFGSRGLGAIIGSLATGPLAHNNEKRMRQGILWAFVVAGIAYAALSGAPTLYLAAFCVGLGHAGTSMSWVFSTTMLQRMTDDRFRGRVFPADFAGLFVMMASVSYIASHLIDLGVSVRTLALVNGLMALIPAALWLSAQRLWTPGQSPPISSEAPTSSTSSP